MRCLGPSARAPAWAWVVLAVAICAMSAGGTFFALLEETPPVLRASWRLWVTSLLQLPGFVRSLALADARLRRRFAANLPLLVLTGAILAVHFGAWSWGLNHTSLTHSLLWVSTHPIVLVLWMAAVAGGARLLLLFRPQWLAALTAALAPAPAPADDQDAAGVELAVVPSAPADPDPDPEPRPTSSSSPSPSSLRRLARGRTRLPPLPTVLETVGSVVGFGGGVLMVVFADVTDSEEVTVAGDLVSFLGAAAMVFYLLVGQRLRQWLPIFLYVFPVNLAAALVAGLAALGLDAGVSAGATTSSGWFGWLFRGYDALWTVCAAAVSGVLGHMLANLALKHISPLVMSVGLLLEPVIGSAIGWLAGQQGAPGVWTWVGGVVLLVGAVLVTLGGRDDHEEEPAEEGGSGEEAVVEMEVLAEEGAGPTPAYAPRPAADQPDRGLLDAGR